MAKNNNVEIIEARALLENRNEVFMDQLTGEISRDSEADYTMAGLGQRVKSITIRAVTRGLVSGRADIEVSVGIL